MGHVYHLTRCQSRTIEDIQNRLKRQCVETERLYLVYIDQIVEGLNT